jgi:hypothetical protein
MSEHRTFSLKEELRGFGEDTVAPASQFSEADTPQRFVEILNRVIEPNGLPPRPSLEQYLVRGVGDARMRAILFGFKRFEGRERGLEETASNLWVSLR